MLSMAIALKENKNIDALAIDLVGDYNLEILTIPRVIFKDVKIKQSQITDIIDEIKTSIYLFLLSVG